ncbi:MAG: hypothetical protein O2908_07880 [Verrucomicrobia bacterium]|nr:hypothetical protein [Verrucomicrobiota bacterium]MDA0906371.1 hypothetical protein [Verrucomicrobiota bacterium]MDA1078956.1 hypothetical protein [Verrucomicrobiota bacterium]
MNQASETTSKDAGICHLAGKYWIRLGSLGMSVKISGLMDEIKSCLEVITNPKDAKPEEFRQTLARLDVLVSEQKQTLHPRLRHFLENRSYQKAVIWLAGETPEKGTCGG